MYLGSRIFHPAAFYNKKATRLGCLEYVLDVLRF